MPYIFEAWGAQGGPNPTGIEGGRGAYVYGHLFLKKSSTFSIEIGASGLSTSPIPTYGNGGMGGLNSPPDPDDFAGGSGGGATTVYSLNQNRLLVAGGGAGSTRYYVDLKGPHAGGLVAPDGVEYHYKTETPLVGCGGNFFSPNRKDCNNNINPSLKSYVSGGGGGYIPGGRGTTVDAGVSSGGGGSSFLSGFYPCQIVENFRFLNGLILGGNETFPSPMTNKTDVGHTGNGAFRLTVIGIIDFYSCRVLYPTHYAYYLILYDLIVSLD